MCLRDVEAVVVLCLVAQHFGRAPSSGKWMQFLPRPQLSLFLSHIYTVPPCKVLSGSNLSQSGETWDRCRVAVLKELQSTAHAELRSL